MAKVRTVLPQTDAERPVTWIAAERLARDHGRMVRLVELLREHRPVLVDLGNVYHAFGRLRGQQNPTAFLDEMKEKLLKKMRDMDSK